MYMKKKLRSFICIMPMAHIQNIQSTVQHNSQVPKIGLANVDNSKIYLDIFSENLANGKREIYFPL